MNYNSQVRRGLLGTVLVIALIVAGAVPAAADSTPQATPFAQNWTDTGLITANDDWAAVPGIVGFLGQDITTSAGTDPQTLLGVSTALPPDLDVIANQTTPNTLTAGGVAEFQITDPVVALQGSGTADAPYLLLHLNTTGSSNISVAYTLRDIDASADNSIQPVALQYRVGPTGLFTNVPAGFVADATTGPSIATQVTPVAITLPSAANDQPLVQVRIITANAVGSDEWVGIDDISATASAFDIAPSVQLTVPTNGATNVALDTTLSITFSEPVDAIGDWFSIDCTSSGVHSAVVTGGPDTFSLDPDLDFVNGESCTLTVAAAGVTDQDASDPPDVMVADYNFSFQTADVLACGAPSIRIHDIQGSGASSPIANTGVTVEAVVIGDYQSNSGFSGFYLEHEEVDWDAAPSTSEGLFVFDGSFGVAVNPGDVVRVRGTVIEFNGLTEISGVNAVRICASGATVTPVSVLLPVASLSDHEPYEGMLVTFDQTLTATEVFTLGRFGEVSLSGAGRLYTPTAITTPGAAAIAQLDQNRRSRIVLDDGRNTQNIDPTRYPQGGLSALNTLRVGDTLSSLTGVMDFRFSNYRIQPVGPITFDATNPRTPAPADVGGNLKIASFNVLNFFNGNGSGLEGAAGGFPTARGATTLFELGRQTDKIVSALTAIDGDIVGLMEIENDAAPDSAIEELVAALNRSAGAGTYAFVDTGTIGTDAIKVALIYKPAAVTPVGTFATITSAFDPRFVDTLNRPSLAQTFERTATGARLTVVVNHLKSKGSNCNAVGDPNTGDGQGNCNRTRTNAAAALVDWLATDPTASGDPDYLIIGDLNAYRFEDPIETLLHGGFTNLVAEFGGDTPYSYVFNGESGYLDHALASASLAVQATGTTDWHINPDEPTVLDYNVEFKTLNQITTFYDPGPYRASDHDPVVIGLNLNAAPSVQAGGPYSVGEGGSITVTAAGNDGDGDPLVYAWDLDDDGSFETVGASVTFDASAIDGPATRTIRVRATDAGGLWAESSTTVNISNVAPTATFNAPASVFAGFPFTLSLTSPIDPSGADSAAGFSYAFDCGAGSGFTAFGVASTASCPTSLTGIRTVGAKIRDKDGGISEYSRTVAVIVTYDSLCALTRTLLTKPGIANALCGKLDKAEAAAAIGNDGVRDAYLRDYRKQLDAQTGKSVTAANAGLLKSLSLALI